MPFALECLAQEKKMPSVYQYFNYYFFYLNIMENETYPLTKKMNRHISIYVRRYPVSNFTKSEKKCPYF